MNLTLADEKKSIKRQVKSILDVIACKDRIAPPSDASVTELLYIAMEKMRRWEEIDKAEENKVSIRVHI